MELSGDKTQFIIDTTTANFRKDVLEESLKQPVLVDFWSPQCDPCRILTPLLEKLVREQNGKIKLVKLNTQSYPQIPQQLQIQSVPTVFAFIEGRPVDGFVGAISESEAKSFIKKIINMVDSDPLEAALEEAQNLFNMGDMGAAAQLYANILAHDPANVKALAALVKIHIKMDDIEGAKRFLEMVPEELSTHQDITTVRTELELLEQAAAFGDVSDLRRKIAENPEDYQSRLDLSIALNARGKKEEALDLLLEIIKKNRDWNEDAARKQLLQFFDIWGPTDPHVKDGRRRLSSLLFS